MALVPFRTRSQFSQTFKTLGEISAKLFISGFAEKYRVSRHSTICESGLDMNETEAYVSPKGKPSLTIYQVLGVFRRRSCAQDRSDRVVDRGAVGIAGSALSFC